MTLDVPTLMSVGGVVAAVCGLPLIASAATNRNDPVGRMWSVAFIAAMGVAVGYGVALLPEIWWGIAVGNAAFVYSAGAVWSGCRMFNGHTSLFWISSVCAAMVLGISLASGPHEGEWAGALVLWPEIAGLYGLAAWEVSRSRLYGNLNGQVLRVALWVVSVFFLLRSIVFMAEGPAGPNFSVYFSTASTALVAIVLMVTGTMAVVSLRSESVGRTGAMALGRGFHSSAGVLSAQSFEQAVTDHLQRAVCDQVGLAVIEANLENLPAINLVFGRGSGDEAIRRFASTVRRIVPVLAVIGHWSPGRFLVLVRVDNAAEAQRIGARIQTALIDDPLAELHHIRLTASVGTADTFTGGYSLAELMAIAEAAVQTSRAAAVGAQLAANESYLT